MTDSDRLFSQRGNSFSRQISDAFNRQISDAFSRQISDAFGRQISDAFSRQISDELTFSRQITDELTISDAIEAANAPIFGIDTEGRVTEWNQKAAKFLGWKKAEVTGRSLVDTFITDEFQEKVRDALSNALQGNETTNFELTLFSKSGTRHEILLNMTTRLSSEGQITGVLGVCLDITESHAQISKQHLMMTEDLSQTIDTANVPIFGVSVNGLVTEWNRRVAELSGFPKEDMLSRAFVEDIITSDYQSKVQSVLTDAFQGVETANFEFPLVTAQGQTIDILLNVITRRNQNGDVTEVFGIGRDITLLRRAMDSLDQQC